MCNTPRSIRNTPPARGATYIPAFACDICTETLQSQADRPAQLRQRHLQSHPQWQSLENQQRNYYFSALPSPELLQVGELTLGLMTQAQQNLH